MNLSLVAATSQQDSLPYGVFNGKGWKAELGASYVKLHMHADEPFDLGRIEVKWCGAAIASRVVLYGNFDEWTATLNPTDLTANFPSARSVRSLTINFGQNKSVCVSAVKLYGAGGAPITVTVPNVVGGTVTASSTLAPADSYDVMNLFDSKFEYAWSTNGTPTGDALTFAFAAPQRVEKIRIWNGYQRSDTHCFSNARVKTLTLSGDGGYSATVAVADVMGSQTVVLPKPFEGSSLKLTVDAAYPGKKYQDLVISELRLYNGQGWFTVDPSATLSRIALANKGAFQKAGLTGVLDQGLQGEHDHDKNAKVMKYGDWVARFRSDGSFYMEGNTYQSNTAVSYDFYALGNYEVKEIQGGTMKLRVFGFMRKLKYDEGDCNGCGRDCNQAVNESGAEEKIFQDVFYLSQAGNSTLLENREKAKKLNFDRLRLSSDGGHP